MLIDRTHKPWLFFSALIVAASASAYAVGMQSFHGVTGGSVLGLIFGVVGSLFMVIAGLLAVRKRFPTWRIGSAQFWLRAHLWLGTVGFLLILLHSGFHWGGLLENLLWISFGLVVVTGFAGLALQQVIPRLLTSQVPLETFVAQIPFLSKTMLFRADQLVATQTGPLDVPFETLTPFAVAVLKQQGVLKRESDLPKELAKAYANVPQPEPDAKKGHAAEKPALAEKTASVEKPAAVEKPATTAKPAISAAPAVAIVPAVAGSQETARNVIEPPPKDATDLKPTTPAVDSAAGKKLSPMEIMRAKKAAQQSAASATSELAPAQEIASSPETTEAAATPAVPPTEKKLSPMEIMRAKKAAQQSATAATSEPAPAQDVPASPATTEAAATSAAPSTEKKLSPMEIMRAKKAAQQSAVAALSEPAPVQDVPASPETTEVTATPAVPETEKKLSPMEIMRAKKLMAAKGSPADTPAETPKPLTVAKQTAVVEVSPVEATSDATVAAPPAASPVVKKPLPISKPAGGDAKASASAAASKAKPEPIPAVQLAELRDFHLKIVRPYLDKGLSPQHGLSEAITARRLFAQLRSDLPAELHEVLGQLEAFCEERRQFAMQKRLHRWMHWWLILHIPPSIALMVLFVAHVVVSLRVVPFGR